MLAILLAGAVTLAVWYAADPAAWIGYENQHGPVRAVVSFVLLLPAGLLGWRRPLTGAVLLLVLGLAPAGIVGVSAHLAASFAAISGPAAIGGLLYLFAALTARHHGHPAHPEPTRAAHPRPYRPAGRTGLLPAAPPAAKGLGTQRRAAGNAQAAFLIPAPASDRNTTGGDASDGHLCRRDHAAELPGEQP